MFMSATVDTAVHLGQDYQENSHSSKNTKGRTSVRRVTEVDFESRRILRDIHYRLGNTTMAKDSRAERQGSPTVDSKRVYVLL